MATIRGGYAVQPHVQAFADWAEANYGIDSFGTYAGHQPTPDRAVDCFGTRPEMLALAQACTRDDVIDRFGIDYVIHDIDPGDHDPGEIWNREIARKWREMADRHSPTQNHYDHVHVSFDPAPGNGGNQGDGFLMALTDQEQHDLAQRVANIQAWCEQNWIDSKVEAIADAVVRKLPPGGSADVAAIAKAVADEVSRRLDS